MVTIDLNTDLLGVFTPGEVNTISGIFKCMDIAEQEIAAAQERHPEKAGLLWECFALCKPPSLLDGKADVMYRAHCRELLERVATGEDVAEPTDAELMAAFSVVSLATPLTDAATFAYVQLFQSVFDDIPPGLAEVMDKITNGLDMAKGESIRHEASVLIDGLKRRLYTERETPQEAERGYES
jgi:hypothetical protein